jgi:hypothetical protein
MNFGRIRCSGIGLREPSTRFPLHGVRFGSKPFLVTGFFLVGGFLVDVETVLLGKLFLMRGFLVGRFLGGVETSFLVGTFFFTGDFGFNSSATSLKSSSNS